MNEKQAKRLRQALGYKPVYQGRKYQKKPTLAVRKMIDPKTWRDKPLYIQTGEMLVTTGLRWRYLRYKDAIREAKRL